VLGIPFSNSGGVATFIEGNPSADNTPSLPSLQVTFVL